MIPSKGSRTGNKRAIIIFPSRVKTVKTAMFPLIKESTTVEAIAVGAIMQIIIESAAGALKGLTAKYINIPKKI